MQRSRPHLESLAFTLDTATRSVFTDRFALALGASTDDPDEVHVRTLTGGDPAAELVGFDAPHEWDTFGVVISDDGSSVVYLVDRRGDELGLTRTTRPSIDGSVRSVSFVSEGPATGRLTDVCRRVLGLATMPPHGSPAEFAAAVWLDRLVVSVLHGEVLEWPAMLALQPDHLAGAASTTWAQLRERCAAGVVCLDGITACDAAWMDDGMFARFALDPFPELNHLLEPLEALLPPATTCQIIDELSARGLL